MEQDTNLFGGREAARGGARVGERLAEARDALGLTVEAVAERTRIPKRHLDAIEAGSAEGLPALTYSVGFVRTYARMVGLEPEECARQFRAEMGQPVRRDVPEPYEPTDPKRVPGKLLAIVALLLAIVVAGGYAVWRGDGLFGGGAEQRSRIAAGTDPALYTPAEIPTVGAPAQGRAQSPPAAPPASSDGPVAVTATEDVWVQISVGGRRLFTGVMPAGKRIEIARDAIDPTIRTGRAQSLKVTVGDLAMQPLGPPDTLIRAASLKRADLLSKPAFQLVPVAMPDDYSSNAAPSAQR